MRGEAEVNHAVDTYADMVRRVCFYHLKNQADTEDVFQEVFLKYMLHDEPFKNKEHEKAWLLRVAINACKDYLKNFISLGISAHSIEQVKEAEDLGADYVTFGHVFETDCKKGLAPKGIEALCKVCRASNIPVYGLGGITLENRKEVMDAGAAGYCMMSGVMGSFI